MNVTPTTFTVADYCQLMERGEISVNRAYQRSDRVWPAVARSYLIESLILGFPLPKFTLHQVTDLRSRKTVKEIVDGQQRSTAIFHFYSDQLSLAPSLETPSLRGKSYSELDDDDQGRFLSAVLTIDLLAAADNEEVREAFRRVNSYTVPLNPEEERHAVFQGPFKWFANQIASEFGKTMLRIGIFTEKQLVRMADTKLLAEVCDAFIYGIRTTNKALLDRLYEQRDVEFPERDELGRRLTGALDILDSLPEIHGTSLVRPHIAYSLVLAVSHVMEPCRSLEKIYRSPSVGEVNRDSATRHLLALNDALDNEAAHGKYRDFVAACTSKTNVKQQRETRFRSLCEALVGEMP